MSPWNDLSNEADAGVEGTVAWAAGPSAADSGVAGTLNGEELEPPEEPRVRW